MLVFLARNWEDSGLPQWPHAKEKNAFYTLERGIGRHWELSGLSRRHPVLPSAKARYLPFIQGLGGYRGESRLPLNIRSYLARVNATAFLAKGSLAIHYRPDVLESRRLAKAIGGYDGAKQEGRLLKS